MPAPTLHTLAARIAAQELGILNMLRRLGRIDEDEFRARCDGALDQALDCATVAVWAHTNERDAAAEILHQRVA